MASITNKVTVTSAAWLEIADTGQICKVSLAGVGGSIHFAMADAASDLASLDRGHPVAQGFNPNFGGDLPLPKKLFARVVGSTADVDLIVTKWTPA
jgi:hypothetical protein